MLNICSDNGASMDTGIQCSSATPRGAHTTTCPVQKVMPGKPRHRIVEDIDETRSAECARGMVAR